jgi:hypothetical protein
MFYLYDEIYWYRSININSYEMMVTYVYFTGVQVQNNIDLTKLKYLLTYSVEFKHFVIAVCNDFYKFNNRNYDFIFAQVESKIILTLVQVNYDKITNLFANGSHEEKQNYLSNYTQWNHKIME